MQFSQMQIELIIKYIEQEVAAQFQENSADHDLFHIQRVVRLAQAIQAQEGGDFYVITAAAWLHDISDHKLNGGKLNDNGRVSRQILEKAKAPEEFILRVLEIVDAVSFKGAKVQDSIGSLELNIVRDADRLDAIGAIGIARALHYGGAHERPFYVPEESHELHDSFESYVSSNSHTLNHFHEKLLLLKDRMLTQTGKKIAEKRHAFMLQFVENFYAEWEVRDFTF